jgi:hypothetical protein
MLASFQEASNLDYFITTVDGSTATAESIVTTYGERNWIEVFYREALVLVGAI